jgi:hypothetical protein
MNGIKIEEVVDVFNLPPYGCSRRLYFQKIGDPSFDACSVNDERHKKALSEFFGEPLADIYRKTTGRKVRTPNYANFIDPLYPFIISNPDRLITNLKGKASLKYVPMEIRVLNRAEFYEIRRNGLPDHYYSYQLHHAMIGKTAKWAALTLFCPDVMEMKVFDIAYDETVAAEVIKAEKEFWDRVKFTGENVPNFAPKNCCNLCGYRHQCLTDVREYTKEEKEILEVSEIVPQIEKYAEKLL